MHAGEGKFGPAVSESTTPTASLSEHRQTQAFQLWCLLERSWDHDRSMRLWVEALTAVSGEYMYQGGWLLKKARAQACASADRGRACGGA